MRDGCAEAQELGWCSVSLCARRMKKFDAFSFKKIVAPDFFESTLPGAWLSIAGGIVMLLLFVAELRGYLAVTLMSEVTMELGANTNGADDLLRINFDVSLPLLSCQYVTVDMDDVLGRRKINVTSASIVKFRMDQGSGKLLAAAPAKPKPPEYGHGTGDVGPCSCDACRSRRFSMPRCQSTTTTLKFWRSSWWTPRLTSM